MAKTRSEGKGGYKIIVHAISLMYAANEPKTNTEIKEQKNEQEAKQER